MAITSNMKANPIMIQFLRGCDLLHRISNRTTALARLRLLLPRSGHGLSLMILTSYRQNGEKLARCRFEHVPSPVLVAWWFQRRLARSSGVPAGRLRVLSRPVHRVHRTDQPRPRQIPRPLPSRKRNRTRIWHPNGLWSLSDLAPGEVLEPLKNSTGSVVRQVGAKRLSLALEAGRPGKLPTHS